MAAALVAAPAPRAESRPAVTTIVSPASPGSVSRTLRSETCSPSWVPSSVCSETAPAGTSSKRLRTRSAIASSPALPGVRSGAAEAIWRATPAARSPSNVVGGSTGSSASGTPSSENIAITTASSAGMNERR